MYRVTHVKIRSFEKTIAFQTHFGFTNIKSSEMHSFLRGTRIQPFEMTGLDLGHPVNCLHPTKYMYIIENMEMRAFA